MPLGVLRRSTAAFDTREARLLEGLLPHLRRALLMTVRLLDAERQAAGMRIVAGASDRAVMLLDGEGRLVCGNDAAHALIAEGDGIALRGGKLALGAGHGRRLATLVEQAATRSGDCGGAMGVERSDGLRLALLVTPAAAPDDAPRPAGGVLVTAVVVGARQVAPVERLRQLFGLTLAEAEVVDALFAGGSPESIASDRRVSLTTVRSQLSAIYAKTGAASATQLMRLVGPLAEYRERPADPGQRPMA